MQKLTLILRSIFITALLFTVAFSVSVNSAKAVTTTSFVIKLRAEVNESVLQNLSVKNLQPMFAFSKDQTFAGIYQFESSETEQELETQLAGQFEFLEVNEQFKVKSNTEFIPNDPGFVKNAANIDRQWGLHKVNLPQAWKLTTGSRKVIVAVIDTGVDETHEDLKGTRFKTGFNALTANKISSRTNSDDNGHGTLITGVIAATTNNEIGIAGAAFNASIMPIKALDSDGSGSATKISEAIVWAADHDADVINLSLGGMGFGHNKVLANAISYAYSKDIVIVAAAGNDVAITGGNLDKDPVFPVCGDNSKNMIIGVTATDVNDLKPAFANYGKACVDVSAPGRRILSTINHDPATGTDSPDSYAYASGTSLAAPLVSAQAALLRSLYPEATNGQIRDRILATATNIDNLNLSQCDGGSCKGFLGTGRIDIAKSLQERIVSIEDGDVVQVKGTENFYYINGGKKQPIIPFVRNQRFAFTKIKTVAASELENFSEGSYAEPNDGTLVKSPTDPAVYMMQNGLRSPITYQVFLMRGFKFSDVVNLTNIEVGSWVVGSFVTPPDNSVIRSASNPTIYWTINGSIHAVNYKFFIDRGLDKIPLVYMPDGDIAKFPKGEPYTL